MRAALKCWLGWRAEHAARIIGGVRDITVDTVQLVLMFIPGRDTPA